MEAAIFGEARGEWSSESEVGPPLRPFLFLSYFDSTSGSLRVLTTDYHSNTFEAVRSVEQLDDMRDTIGIGGSWSDFIDYVIASLKSDDNIKLILEGNPRQRDVATRAKLIAQRSKGMPLISIPLVKLDDNASANDAMAHLSFELYKTYTKSKMIHSSIGKENNEVAAAPSLTNNDHLPAKSVVAAPSKLAKHVLPPYRRSKKRGALLQDTDDDDH